MWLLTGSTLLYRYEYPLSSLLLSRTHIVEDDFDGISGAWEVAAAAHSTFHIYLELFADNFADSCFVHRVDAKAIVIRKATPLFSEHKSTMDRYSDSLIRWTADDPSLFSYGVPGAGLKMDAGLLSDRQACYYLATFHPSLTMPHHWLAIAHPDIAAWYCYSRRWKLLVYSISFKFLFWSHQCK